MRMQKHAFTIIATGLHPEGPDFEDRLFEAGCDDAIFAFQRGVMTFNFDRQAHSLQDAIEEAIENVRAAGANVARVEPDYLVNLSDIADRAGLTRQAIALYACGERRFGFPTPTARVTTSHPLYDWQNVAEWLVANGKIAEEIAVQARVLKATNEALIRSSAGTTVCKECIPELETV